MIPMPPELNKALGNFIDVRGGFLTLFAQVEWFLAKIIVEANGFPEYQDLDLSFSQDFEKRAARVRKILSISGPLSPYADELLAAIDRISAFTDLRNFSAHGVLTHRWTNETLLLRFRMFKMFKGGELKDGLLDCSLEEYHDALRQASNAAKEFSAVVSRIWTDLGMANFEPQF